MRIAAIRTTPINVPLETPYEWVFGELPGFTKTIIEVETDDGVVGLGEAPSHGAADLIQELFAPRLIGRDPIDIHDLESLCVPPHPGVQSVADFPLLRAFGGLEVALWDIRGKVWQRPLYDLLGGAVRRDIPFTDYFAFRPETDGCGGEATPEAVADYCVQLHEAFGTTYFEGKFSAVEPRRALRTVELIRERLGDEVMIRIDSNAAYSLPTAKRLAPALEELLVRNWEDPVATMEAMAALGKHTSIPFSTHNLDLPKAVHLGAPHALVGDPSGLGGIGRTLAFVGACEQMGIDFWCYSGDSGIMSAVYLHLCAALHWIREPNQSLFRMQPYDVIEEGPFRPRNNTVPVPSGHGLGVTLSHDRLAFLHRHFLNNGPMNKYHDPKAPNRYRRLPLI